jgi:Tol biopolymer transport system component
MRKFFAVFAVLMAAALALSSTAQPNQQEQFEKALVMEEVQGKLQDAIALYQKIVDESGDRALVAKSLLQMGKCYEKLGNSEAQKAYQQVVRDYADQAESAAEARSRLAALSKPAAAESGPITRRVWAGPKTDFFGQVSPDGKYISFVDWDTGDLAIRDLKKGTNRRLTNKGSWESSGAEVEKSIWSPDSKQIVYQWFQWETEPNGYELRLISLDDPTPRVLYKNKSSDDWITPLDWSPDGQKILAVLSMEEGDEELVLVSTADGKIRLLKRFSQSVGLGAAAFSPDGRWLVYDYPQSESALTHDIILLPIEEGSEKPLIEYPADDRVLGWSMDGKWVLFASDRRGSVDIWAIRAEEGKAKDEPVIVKSGIGHITPLGFANSGAFYFGIGGNRNDVYVAKLDPKTGGLLAPPTKLIKHSEGFNRSPRYSPDGKYLAYISTRIQTVPSGGISDVDSLCLRNLETGEESEYSRELIRAGAIYISCPRWSPDGKSILLYGQDNKRRSGFYYLNLETGSAVNVFRASQDMGVGCPAGWRDETSFVYGRLDRKRDRGEICVRNLVNGSEKILFGISPAVNGAVYVSPDRRWVSATENYESGEKALRIISIASGESTKLFKFDKENQPDRARYAWSADSKYILYVKASEVWRISIDTGLPQKTGLSLPTSLDHMSAHPDGEQLAFQHWGSKVESPPEVWVMENFLRTQGR